MVGSMRTGFAFVRQEAGSALRGAVARRLLSHPGYTAMAFEASQPKPGTGIANGDTESCLSW